MRPAQQQNVAVCLASDAKYFEFLDGMLASLEDASLPKAWRICLFDLGLNHEQRANLQARGIEIISPDWPLAISNVRELPRWFHALINRPFLPDYFPGYEAYLWLDCDGWVQQGDCLVDYVNAAGDGQMAAVFERFGPPRTYQVVDRNGRERRFSVSEQGCRQNLANAYRICFGPETAHLGYQTIANTGMCCLRGDSGVWKIWQKYLARGIAAGVQHVLVELLAFNLAMHLGEVAVREMPWRYDWNISTDHPMIDLSRGLFVDPMDRQTPVGIIHLIDVKDLASLMMQTTTGQTVQVPLRYRLFVERFRPVRKG